MAWYEFEVDCADRKSCNKVCKNMKNMGYEKITLVQNVGYGDHTAVKKFPSLQAARKEAVTIGRDNPGLVFNIGIRRTRL